MQIMCNTTAAYHVQHTVRQVRRDSSAIKFDRAEIAFNLNSFHWMKPVTNTGGEGTVMARTNP